MQLMSLPCATYLWLSDEASRAAIFFSLLSCASIGLFPLVGPKSEGEGRRRGERWSDSKWINVGRLKKNRIEGLH